MIFDVLEVCVYVSDFPSWGKWVGVLWFLFGVCAAYAGVSDFGNRSVFLDQFNKIGGYGFETGMGFLKFSFSFSFAGGRVSSS